MRHKQGGVWAGLSWQEFLDQGRAIGLALLNSGLRPGEVVTILSENRPEWLVVDMAVQAVGAISHGLYPGSATDQVAHALEAAGPVAVFVENTDQLMKVLPAASLCTRLRLVVVMDAQGLRGADDPRIVQYADLLARGLRCAELDAQVFDEFIDAGATSPVAVLLGTAGTTGSSRLVAVNQAGVLARVRQCARWLTLGKGDHCLSFTPLSQAGEHMAVLAALLVHDSLVHFPENSATLINDLVEVAPHVLLGPPRFWEKMHYRVQLFMEDAMPLARTAYGRSLGVARRSWWHRAVLRRVQVLLGLQRLRMALVVGASLSGEVAAWYTAIGIPLHTGYCVAEAGGFCSIQPISDEPSAPALDVGLHLELAEEGEILVRGAGAGAGADDGYWTNGQLLPFETSAEGYLRTGDFGAATASGIRVLGRVPAHAVPGDGQPALPEIAEDALRASAYIADAVFLVETDRPGRCVLVLEEDSIRKYAQDREVPFADYASLVHRPEVRSLISEQVELVNRRLCSRLQVVDFQVVPLVYRTGDEEWTPALRLNRRVVARKYARAEQEPVQV